MKQNIFIKDVEKALQQIIDSGIPEKTIMSQLDVFKDGIRPIQINRPCTHQDGIIDIPDDKFDQLKNKFSQAVEQGRVMKFVPASGAATRMFKPLASLCSKYETIDQKTLEQTNQQIDSDKEFTLNFIHSLHQFSFFTKLKSVLSSQGESFEQLYQNQDYKKIIESVLTEKGLNYANVPKGMIPFHTYGDQSRTAFEEHLVEAVSYTTDRHGIARIHFTVPPQHKSSIETHFLKTKNQYEKDRIRIDISLSIQKNKTNTIAVNIDNQAFRTQADELLFRPSGHGALLENLNELNGDIIFLKNIDNVVPDHLKPWTFLYKKVLGGHLIQLQERIFAYIIELTKKNMHQIHLPEIQEFAQNELFIYFPHNFNAQSTEKQIDYLIHVMNRPIRVCGMVKNQGQAGGGSFWVDHADQSLSLQIVEKTQVDFQNPGQESAFNKSTHFNPVDLVCGVKDYKGNAFDLINFVDYNAGFISYKSKDGKDLKALELPSLWNGSMADWITVFVEVPLITFNPVKTVNDLLKKEHQNLQTI